MDVEITRKQKCLYPIMVYVESGNKFSGTGILEQCMVPVVRSWKGSYEQQAEVYVQLSQSDVAYLHSTATYYNFFLK